ncbi:aspartyl protease family protein 1-like isoform X2 [Hibiscus syriacus]|uniref:aspartyl protease family protein 1-like isoform X2 n=1 Tax=Hibiscus syriacus TaxID=106335 RepID=UPI0019208A56|nr:aspartyl protease family protein 1-like isoform X2 [Hibiscus syriacus]
MFSSSKTVFFFWILSFNLSYGRIFTFKMHHLFSEPVKNWSNSTGKLSHWPAKGSFEYYAVLAHRDRLLRGRKLSDINATLSFSDANSTFRISSLGFLHYTTVKLGTPGVKFMVALDTGSDLFWVPCDCTQCAPTEGTTYASDFELSIYDPKGSSTSKKVTCNSSLCAHRNQCLGTFSSCPYIVSYMSAQTSTSGVLLEDVLHLTTGDGHPKLVEAYVTFGCGQVQSGSFLDVAAPNGLFGLGMEKIAVPSILSQEGLTANSFSMCFGSDGIGRISFGDKGSPDQQETPFNLNPSHPTYNITVTQIRVGTTIIAGDITALFDSGTSFTYLVDPAYSNLAENFHSQAQDRRRPPDSRIPFEYCYDMSPDANATLIPSMSLTMKGGHHFPVHDPIIVISTRSKLVYCLAVIKSTELNIIGQNFMTGYRIVFDREKMVLGWKPSDCYDKETSNTLPVKPSTAFPPAVAVNPEATAGNRNGPNNSGAPSSITNPSTRLKTLFYTFTLALIPFFALI